MGRHLVLAVLVSLVLVSVAPQANGAGGVAIISCGQVVTTSAYLIQDLYCPDGVGIVVGASGIKIDLNGFTLRGDGGEDDRGVLDSGFVGVTIQNGVIRSFGMGVAAVSGADSTSIVNVVSTGNTTNGIMALSGSALVKSSNLSGNGWDGISFEGAALTIQSTTAVGNTRYGVEAHGFAPGGTYTAKIQSTIASGNGHGGIWLDGYQATLKKNRTEGNGFIGGSDLAGRGIEVINFTIPPVGKNVARGNDDPTECNPAYLC